MTPTDLLHIHQQVLSMQRDQPYKVSLPSGDKLLFGAILSGSEWRKRLKTLKPTADIHGAQYQQQ